MNSTTKTLAYSGLMAALAFISTSIISIPNAFTGGYIHLGDAIVLSCGIVLGKKYGALSAGIGSAMADLYLGYAQWALPTFIIKALMAFFIGYIFEQGNHKKRLVAVSITLLSIWSVFTFLISTILGNGALLLRNTDYLISDEVITDPSALSSLASYTQKLVLASGVVLPIIAFLLFFIFRNNKTIFKWVGRVIAFTAAGSVMMSLYFATYGILYGNWIAPMFSIPSNLVQYLFGVIIATLLMPITLRFEQTSTLA